MTAIVKSLLVGALSVATVVLAAAPGSASWTSNNCYSNHHSDTIFQRKGAQAYASVADNEGYEWGGGCWNNNDTDDTPGAPDSGGEGPDCSGFVFKTWELVNSAGTSGGTWWDKFENVHGPYSSYDYHSPASSDPFHTVSKGSMMYMDAFARDGHVAMLASKVSPDNNLDYVWEALGDSSGTDLNLQGYRSDDRYSGVRREGWTADCYPNCVLPSVTRIVFP